MPPPSVKKSVMPPKSKKRAAPAVVADADAAPSASAVEVDAAPAESERPKKKAKASIPAAAATTTSSAAVSVPKKSKGKAAESSAPAVAPPTPAKVAKKSSKSKKQPSPSPEPSASDSSSESESAPAPGPGKKDQKDEEEESDNEPTAEAEETHLYGFSSGEDDSSDEEDSDGDEDMKVDDRAVDLGKLPTVAKDDATVKRKLAKAHKLQNVDRGVIYLGRIPHGFYEDELKGYFSQFGEVTRVRLSRSKKTGRSKHYGFLEFSSLPVAEIVVETMDNYLLLGHILSCKLVPKESVHAQLWVGANRKWRRVPEARVQRVVHNRDRDEEERAQVEALLIKRQKAKARKIAAAGIDYDLTPVGYSTKPVIV